MSGIALDYRDELQSAADFIAETIQAAERFRSYHWVVATADKQRFAGSSAIVGGPVDMSPLANAKGPGVTVRHHLRDMLGFKAVYAVDLRPDEISVSPKDVLAHFRDCPPEKLIVITASGQRLSEASPWLLNLAFVALDQPDAFLERHAGKLATEKPLRGSQLYSKKDKWS